MTLRARSHPAPDLVVAVSSDRVRAARHETTRRLAEAARMVLRAEKVRAALISVSLVSQARIAALNFSHLHRRGPTDVIAFGLTAAASTRRGRRALVVGDVYIAAVVARDNARRLGISMREELLRLVVHGVLHVLGYDHPDGESRERSAMWRRQETLVQRALKTRPT